jgi:hypothetical protein
MIRRSRLVLQLQNESAELGVFDTGICQPLLQRLDVPFALQSLLQLRLEAAGLILCVGEFILDLLQSLHGRVVFGVPRRQIGPHSLESGGLLVQTLTRRTDGLALPDELLPDRLKPLPPLLQLGRVRGKPILKRLYLGLPLVPFGADKLPLACAGLGGFELSLEADHLGNLRLQRADLRAEPVAFGLAVGQLLSEHLGVPLALSGLVQLLLEGRHPNRLLGRRRFRK